MDDVIKVSGHRLGTAEVESALVSHPAVAEAAAIGLPHDVKGQAIHTFVLLRQGFAASPDLAEELQLPDGHKSHYAMMLGYPKYRFHRVPKRDPAKVTWRQVGGNLRR